MDSAQTGSWVSKGGQLQPKHMHKCRRYKPKLVLVPMGSSTTHQTRHRGTFQAVGWSDLWAKMQLHDNNSLDMR